MIRREINMAHSQVLECYYQLTRNADITSVQPSLSQSDHWWHKSYMLGCYRANAAAELFNTKRGKALPYRQLSKHGLIRVGSCQHLLPKTCFFRFYIHDSGASSLSPSFKCWLLWISTHLKHVLTVASIKNVLVCWGMQMHTHLGRET